MDWLTEKGGWLLGSTALASLAIAGWAYLKGLGSHLLGHLVCRFECSYQLRYAMASYAKDRLSPSPFSEPYFDAGIINVRPRGREQMVVAESVGVGGKLYWNGWRPIWLQIAWKKDQPNTVKGWFLRGTFNLDQLLIDVAEHYNIHVLGDSNTTDSRYAVRHVFGTAGKTVAQMSDGQPGFAAKPISEAGDIGEDRERRAKRLLKWSHDDLGPTLVSSGRALDRLALSAEVSAAIAEFEQWLALEHWYKSRGIPWRTNWLCFGPPGTGKSSIVQALAEDHGLPIWVFDLATLYNDELHREWNRMLEQVPCIALMEDLDKVFEGPKNISNGDLTLDCLLNCIDGVSRANGLFLVMTTNRIDALDPALKRPGRADSILEMGPPDEAGRLKIARRILPDEPDLCEELAARHVEMSGAEFQRTCEREALRLLKAGHHKQNGHARELVRA